MDKYTEQFEKVLANFVGELQNFVSTEKGDWSIKGFIDIYKNVYTISSDTKIVSKILEIHIFPEILRFAENNGYNIVLAEHQNWYPDITFIKKDNKSIKYALDLKTTYRRNGKVSGFTLGSHGAYFKERDKAKNIQFPYNDYKGHYCLGVIYSRVDINKSIAETKIHKVNEFAEQNEDYIDRLPERKVTEIDSLRSITSVIKDFEFFAAPKWKIASDKAGSGNTANIGSIKDIEDLKSGNGVFSKLGEKWFDEYWINYGKASMMKNGKPVKITNIFDFLKHKNRSDLFDKVISKVNKREKKHE